MARYEMAWDCPRCETKGLLGLSHRHCPSCGAPQDPSRRYFPPEDQKVAVEDHPFHGKDRTCPACDSPNARAASCCVNCGAPLGGAKDVRLTDEVKPAPPPPPATSGNWKRVAAVIALVGAVALLLCLGLLGMEFLGGSERTVTVSEKSWSRRVQVEQYREVRDSAWDEAVPKDARNVSCQREQRDTERVPDGEDCRTEKVDHGDGTYSSERRCTTRYRSEPVYDEKCTYLVERWVDDHAETASGTTDPPRWPVPTVGGTGLGATREGARSSRYQVTVSSGSESWPCATDEARFAAMAPGSMWTTEFGGLTGDPDCDALAPLR